jgi:hypothetical protein
MMKKWVNPFLKSQIDFNTIITDGQKYECLVECFSDHYHFGPIDDYDEPRKFKRTFGYTLANLPEEIFFNLLNNKNRIYFVFSIRGSAEVKVFPVREDIKKDKDLRIVTFPYDILNRPCKAIVGTIAHEIAHVYARDIFPGDDIERKADNLVKQWGFEEELKAHKHYWEERRKQAT